MVPSAMVAKVKNEGGFDTAAANMDNATILGWLNEAYERLTGESKFVRKTRELGPTVADQATYALPDEVIDLRALKVGTSAPWLRVSTEELWELQAGYRALETVTGVGVFAPSFESDADAMVELWPVPTAETAGLSISALAAVALGDLSLATDVAPLLPADVQGAVVDGAIAIGMRRIHERWDIAQAYDAKLDAGIQALAKRTNSRVGSGPIQAKIKGVHF
jgi:hypothetical protein